jgi:DNA repair exonuclease SbcCD nuclease subunit
VDNVKALVTSDWHLDWMTEGQARFADIHAAVQEVKRIAIQERVNKFYFLGDLCDPDKNLSVVRCIETLMLATLDMAEAGIESTLIPGNHCVIEDGSGATVLTPFRALHAFTDKVRVYEQPCFSEVGGVDTIMLPFTPLSHTYNPEDIIRDAYRLRGSNPNRPLIVLSHLVVNGISPGEETTEMPRGRDIVLPHRLIGELFPESIIFQGHYHRRQKFENVNVCGSLVNLTFGEQAHKPGFLIAEF